MKNLLIVVSPGTDSHIELAKRMMEEAVRIGPSVRQVLPTAFLVNGEKAFDVAFALKKMTVGSKLPIAIFEAEEVLSVESYKDVSTP